MRNLWAGREQERFVKAKVKMKVDTAFKKGINVGSKEDGLTWVDFKYERLPTFYYYCGRTRHEENTCEEVARDEEEGKTRSKELGPWLKAEQTGRRISQGTTKSKAEKGEKRNEEKRKEKLAEKLMKKLASLSMSDTNVSDSKAQANPCDS
ncbi:hypothetical protein S83_052125 [Arachis hypogaea]